jgi:hypothetical protein
VIDKIHTNTFREEKVEALNRWPLNGLCLLLFVFLALQPILVVFSQPGNEL